MLIVDDENDMISIMKSILIKAGYKDFRMKNSGKQALIALKTFKPDIIFLDMLMPDMNGEELLKEIRKMGIKAPVVFISGKTDLKQNTLVKKGAFDLIKKPFDFEDVFRILSKVEKMK